MVAAEQAGAGQWHPHKISFRPSRPPRVLALGTHNLRATGVAKGWGPEASSLQSWAWGQGCDLVTVCDEHALRWALGLHGQNRVPGEVTRTED